MIMTRSRAASRVLALAAAVLIAAVALLGVHLDPCRKGHEWRVSRAVYGQAVIGRTYTITR